MRWPPAASWASSRSDAGGQALILDGASPDAIAQAARRLAAGALVAFPTETVYGLGADAGSDGAVAGIFAAKGRPADHPLIVHVTGAQEALHFAREVPPVAAALMQAFWPGPLTVILPRREGIGMAASGGQDSIGLRCPSHPVARALLQACASLQPPVRGLAAPSANRFGRVSPTTASHVQSEFGDELWVLDGGACPVGIESAIVDCTRGQPVLLRPGTLTHAQIESACGQRLWLPHEVGHATPRASGTLESHYAPQARVQLFEPQALAQALSAWKGASAAGASQGSTTTGAGAGAGAAVSADASRPGVWSRVQPLAPMAWRAQPADALAAARELFAMLRDFDEAGVSHIWVELPPDTPEWAGVRDRLRRAAAGS